MYYFVQVTKNRFYHMFHFDLPFVFDITDRNT